MRKRPLSDTKGGKVAAVQEYLFEHWPAFELIGRRPGQTRLLNGKRNLRDRLNPGRHGLSEEAAHVAPMPNLPPFCSGVPWTIADPRDPICTVGGEDARAFMASMLYETRWWRGRKAGIPPRPLALAAWPAGRTNHLDLTVEELLDLTARRTPSYKSRSHLQGPRGYPFCPCLQAPNGLDGLLSHLGGGFAVTQEPPPPPSGEGPGEHTGNGIPTLLIETGSEA